jgi:DNA polymerase III epsilon subunit-like protein
MKRKVLVIDTETGGLDASLFSLLSVAAIVLNEGVVEEEYYTLVNEDVIIVEDEAMKINRLDLERNRSEGKNPRQVVNVLNNLILKHGIRRGVTIVAHNAPFDVSYMKRLYRLAGVDYSKWFAYRSLCTVTGALLLDQAGRITLPGGSASLDNLTTLWNLKLDRPDGHNALDDARATVLVYNKLIQMLKG